MRKSDLKGVKNLWVVLVTENIQSALSRYPEHLLPCPSLSRGVRHKHCFRALHTLKTIACIRTFMVALIHGNSKVGQRSFIPVDM